MAPPAGPAGPELPQPRYTLTVNSAAVFIAGVAIQLIGFIGSLFVYRYIGSTTSGQAIFGTVQLFLLIASTINVLGDLRLGGGYQWFLARGRSPTVMTGTYLLLRFLMVGAAAGLVLAFSGVSIGGATLAPTSTDLEVLAMFMAIALVWTFTTVYQNYNIGMGNAVRSQYPGLIEACVRAPLVIVAAIYVPTLLGLATAYLIGAVAGALFTLVTIVPLVRRFRRSEATLLFRYSWPLLGALGLGTAASNMVPFIVQGSLGAAALNQFNLANGFRVLLLALPAAIMTPLFPYIAALHKRAEYQALRESLWSALRYSSMLIIPGVMALVIYRVNIVFIVNGAYIAAANPMAILALSTIPGSIALMIGTGLAAIGWRRLELYLTSLQVGILFIVAIALMPPYGLLPVNEGLISASIAVLASATAAFALNTYFMVRLMAVRIFPRSIGLILVSAAVSFFAISQMNELFPAFLKSNAAQVVIGVLIGTLVYFLMLAWTGELSKEDIHRVGESMGLPRSWLEFVSRFCWRATMVHVVQPVDVTRVPGLVTGYRPDEDDSSGNERLPPSR